MIWPVLILNNNERNSLISPEFTSKCVESPYLFSIILERTHGVDKADFSVTYDFQIEDSLNNFIIQIAFAHGYIYSIDGLVIKTKAINSSNSQPSVLSDVLHCSPCFGLVPTNLRYNSKIAQKIIVQEAKINMQFLHETVHFWFDDFFGKSVISITDNLDVIVDQNGYLAGITLRSDLSNCVKSEVMKKVGSELT